MSLNCLTCQVLQRTDSANDRDHHYSKEKESRKFCCIQFDRSWSGNLSPAAAYEQIRNDHDSMSVATKKMKKGHHRRLKTIDTAFGAVAFDADVDGEPKLVRSCGMRRDWSFEDLGKVRDNSMRKEMRVR